MGEKRPEKTKHYFIVSNSTIFEINEHLFSRNPCLLLPMVEHGVFSLNMREAWVVVRVRIVWAIY